MIRSIRSIRRNPSFIRILIAMGTLVAFVVAAGAPHAGSTGGI
jgi:hypothetical protein